MLTSINHMKQITIVCRIEWNTEKKQKMLENLSRSDSICRYSKEPTFRVLMTLRQSIPDALERSSLFLTWCQRSCITFLWDGNSSSSYCLMIYPISSHTQVTSIHIPISNIIINFSILANLINASITNYILKKNFLIPIHPHHFPISSSSSISSK